MDGVWTRWMELLDEMIVFVYYLCMPNFISLPLQNHARKHLY